MFVHRDGSVTGSVNVKELDEIRKAKAQPAPETKKSSKAPSPKEEPVAKAAVAEKKSAPEVKKGG